MSTCSDHLPKLISYCTQSMEIHENDGLHLNYMGGLHKPNMKQWKSHSKHNNQCLCKEMYLCEIQTEVSYKPQEPPLLNKVGGKRLLGEAEMIVFLLPVLVILIK